MQNFKNTGVWLEVKRQNGMEDFILIDHNVFKNRKPGNGNGFETIRVGLSGSSLSSSKTIISKNFFQNCNGELEIISIKSCDNIIFKNIIYNSLGTITLRHGRNNIVANNLINQFNTPNTGGIRIIGDNHLIYQNLIKNVHGDDTGKTAISINNGIQNSDLRGYFPVKNVKIIENVLVNNLFDLTLGIGKDGASVLPNNLLFQKNIIFKKNYDPIFSFSSYININNAQKQNVVFKQNKYFGYNIGKSIDSSAILYEPNFNINDKIDLRIYGTGEKIGIIDNIPIEITDLNIDLASFYDLTKNKIIQTSSINNKNDTTMNLPYTPIKNNYPVPESYPTLPSVYNQTYFNNSSQNFNNLTYNPFLILLFSVIYFFKKL